MMFSFIRCAFIYHKCMYAYMCVRVRMCMYVCVYVQGCMHACMYACMYVCMYVCMRAYKCVYMNACMVHICMCA